MKISNDQARELAMTIKDDIKAFIEAHREEFEEFLANEARRIA